ncbi:glycosyltransferase [Dysgonomonas termitidis]|uniref:Glycosyltransferase n=1 Tax=Dysgonomonas termitidis TaxID=1516126 RepID=A0ABV9KRS9_9BACT
MKKQILFVIESLHCGGAEKSLVTLLNNLDYTHLDISVLLFCRGGLFEKLIPEEVKVLTREFPVAGNKIKYIGGRIKFWILKKMSYRKNMHASQLFWKSFGKYIPVLEKEFHIAIAYNQGFSTYFVSELVVSDKKYAWINTDYIKAGYNPSFDYKFYKSFDKVIAVSPESCNSFTVSMARIGVGINTKVIKDIVDKDLILSMSQEPLAQPFSDTCINLVTVARLTKPKGLDLALQSCRKLIDKGYKVHWYIIGEGMERKNIEYGIEKLGIADAVTLTGFTDNPYPYIKAADIYIQTSLFEGLGLSLIEASLLNKPIVTTNFDTACSIIEHGNTGLICKIDTDDIVKHIELYINDKKLRRTVASNLRDQDTKDKEISLDAFYSLL